MPTSKTGDKRVNTAAQAAKAREDRYAYRDDDWGPGHGPRGRNRKQPQAQTKAASDSKEEEGVWDAIKSAGSGILSSVKETASDFADWVGFGDSDEELPAGSFKTTDGRVVSATTPRVSHGRAGSASPAKGGRTATSNKPTVMTAGRTIKGGPASASYETPSAKRTSYSTGGSVTTANGKTLKASPASVSYETPAVKRKGLSNSDASVTTTGRPLKTPAASASYSMPSADDQLKNDMQAYSTKMKQLETSRKDPSFNSAKLEAELATMKKRLDAELHKRGLPSQT